MKTTSNIPHYIVIDFYYFNLQFIDIQNTSKNYRFNKQKPQNTSKTKHTKWDKITKHLFAQ